MEADDQDAAVALQLAIQEDIAPRASFSTLPRELKARIIKMCVAADQAYRARIKHARGVQGNAAVSLPFNSPVGRSLYMLAAVDKEFNKVTAPWLFSDLKASQTSSSTFRHRVLPLRRNSIVHLDLDVMASASDLNRILDALPYFTNLKSMVIFWSAFELAFGSCDARQRQTDDEDVNCRYQNLWRVLSGVKRLELRGFFRGDYISGISEQCSSLTSLKLEVAAGLNSRLDEALPGLSSLSNLRSLHISADALPGGADVELPESWATSASEWASSSALRHLAIEVASISQRTYTFINSFHKISSLDLTYRSVKTLNPWMMPLAIRRDGRTPIDFTLTALEELESLTVKRCDGKHCTYSEQFLLRDLSTTSLASTLRHLTLSHAQYLSPGLRSKFTNLQTLAFLISHKYGHELVDLSMCTEGFCAKEGIELDTFTTPILWDPIATPSGPIESASLPDGCLKEEVLEKRCEAAAETFRVGQMMLEQARATNDVVLLESLVEGLKPLRKKVLRYLD